MSHIKILIGGDICPVNRYRDLFAQQDSNAILGSFVPIALGADLFIANLECPLIERPDPIMKTGPVLGVPVHCSKGLKSMGLHALGLANNHIMDHGVSGLASTMTACKEEGISIFGAGYTLEEARQIRIFDTKGIRIGLCAMAEREWSIATTRTPGANHLDLMEFVRQMREVRKKIDFLIVLLHAGSEGYELPSPGLMNVCRFLIEEGANIVTCQHSHCVGCYEYYQEQLIVYGQGNFIFDYASHGRKGKTGILISMEIERDGKKSCKFLPFTQHVNRAGIDNIGGLELREFLQNFEDRSESILNSDIVYNSWRKYCGDRKLNLINEILGYGRISRRLNKNGMLIRLRGDSYIRSLLSVIQNESASEVLQTSLLDMLKWKSN